MMSLKVFALLMASLSLVLTEENDFSTRALQRRYSEAILASDYSRTMDNMLKKNFVEWLLARREKKSEWHGEGEGLEIKEGKHVSTLLWNPKVKSSLHFAFPVTPSIHPRGKLNPKCQLSVAKAWSWPPKGLRTSLSGF
uniref:Gastric inhibitory polypeptide n=1 Tax=Chelydra serpentina TaxID=8475 RepID=A0A8C3XQ05_CHESE